MKFIVTMDCNKEDATKAKEMAEEKMRAGDFDGAHKFVTIAQRLLPNLENILQMKTICDVHSSAANKIKGLDNWYAILQVQPLADADTIKKQYRKLALLLHPDKNKCAGAEAAFKLVGEANRWLSDQIKRSQYDVRYRSHSMLTNKYAYANLGRNYAPPNSAAENISSVCTFWTCCKHCGHRYKYLREYINTVMHCSSCRKSFFACNMGCDGVPSSNSTACKKEFQDEGICNTSRQNASTGAESESLAPEMDKNGTVGRIFNKKKQENHKNVAGGRVPKKDDSCTENAAEVRKSQNGGTAMTYSDEITKDDVLKPQTQVKEPQTGATKTIPDLSAPKKDQAAKKMRKAVEESSKSSEADGSDGAGAKTDTNESKKRKSSRKKPQNSYAERGINGDFVSPPNKKTKSAREFESNYNTKRTAEDNKSSELADSGVSSAYAYKGNAKKNVNSENEDVLLAKNKESESGDGNGEDATLSSKIDRDDNGFKNNENPSTLDIRGPDFNVFEVERKTENFAVNQVWSTINRGDGMPRKYALVKKVLNAEFKLRITYLEPVQNKNGTSIPVACGKFKNGKTKEVKDRSIFSGLMHHLPCSSRCVFIYPKKGEIWAIFRDWDEKWNTGVEKHQLPYKYDFVEILSDFHDVNGLGVAYLGKLKGSVSLFHREAQNGICQIQFPPDEMHRFSHKVPAVKVIGEENERVSADSYKLDPAALPKDICQVDEVDVVMDNKIINGKADGLFPKAPKIEVKAKLLKETAASTRKRQKSDDDNGVCSNPEEVKGEASKSHDFSSHQVDEKYTPKRSRKNGEAVDVFKLRKSPRLQTITTQRKDEIASAKQGKKMNTPKKTDKGIVTDSLERQESPSDIHQAVETRERESLKKQGCSGEIPSLSKQNDLPTQLDGSSCESPETTLVSSNRKTPRNNLRSEDKFQVNQIWAIYCNDKEIRSEYVKIKKIETKPNFVLRGVLMEPYPQSKESITRPVTCGEFKLKIRHQLLPLSRFSHQVIPFDSKKNIVKVYPREGEIWALYKNSDSTKEEHDIVEVVEDHCDGEIVKAVVLNAKGFSSLYIYQRKQGPNSGFIVIPKAEMSRFSHRIPAVRHVKRTTRLGDGECWELDPKAIPGCTKS